MAFAAGYIFATKHCFATFLMLAHVHRSQLVVKCPINHHCCCRGRHLRRVGCNTDVLVGAVFSRCVVEVLIGYEV